MSYRDEHLAELSAEADLLRECFPTILENADRILGRLRWSETFLKLSRSGIAPCNGPELPLGMLLECWGANQMVIEGAEEFGKVYVLGFGGTGSGIKEWTGVTAEGQLVVGGAGHQGSNEWMAEEREATGASVVPFRSGEFDGAMKQLRVGQKALMHRFYPGSPAPSRNGIAWHWNTLVGPQPLAWLVAQLNGHRPQDTLPRFCPEPAFVEAMWRDRGQEDPLLGDGKLWLLDHIDREDALIVGLGEWLKPGLGAARSGIACFPTWSDCLFWLRWTWLPAAVKGLDWIRGRATAFELLTGELGELAARIDDLPHGTSARAACELIEAEVPGHVEFPTVAWSAPVPVREYMAARGSAQDWARVAGCEDFEDDFDGVRATSELGWIAAARVIQIRARGAFRFDLQERSRWGRLLR